MALEGPESTACIYPVPPEGCRLVNDYTSAGTGLRRKHTAGGWYLAEGMFKHISEETTTFELTFEE